MNDNNMAPPMHPYSYPYPPPQHQYGQYGQYQQPQPFVPYPQHPYIMPQQQMFYGQPMMMPPRPPMMDQQIPPHPQPQHPSQQQHDQHQQHTKRIQKKKFDPNVQSFIPSTAASISSPSVPPSVPSSNGSLKSPNTIHSTVQIPYDGQGFLYDPKKELSSAPLVVGSSVEAFMEQKLKYRELKRQKKRELEVQHEVPTELTIESDIEHIESNEEPQEKLKSPATINWASVAQSAIKKQPPTPVTSPQQVHKQAQEKLVPVVSNVLEPLGIVVLRFMFDENFMNHSSNIKVPQIIPRGLVNTGNICFMSSIMQLLLYCEPFYKALNIISNKTRHSLDETKSIFDALVEFYHNFNIRLDEKHIERDYGDSFTPLELFKSISKNPRFQHLRWGQQEDAEEFFGYLLDGLHEEFTESVKQLSDDEIKKLNTTLSDDAKLTINKNLRKFHEDEFNSSEISGRNDEDEEDGWKEVGQKKTAKRTVEVKPSPIRKIFGGQFRSVLNIPKSKESQSITLDPFQQIQLDISDDDINTLEDAFTKISSIEEIPMKTSEGLEVIAKRQTFLDKFPDVLVIHLKRFSFGSNGRVEKLTKKVSYPHLFNIPMSCYSSSLKKTTPSELQYKLTGVVYHHGLSSNGGHYTVDVLRSEGKWIRIDDVSIVCLEPVEVLDNSEDAKTAYILMYQKV